MHASHAPSQARLQHTPSTQKPEAQSALPEQERPLPFGPLQVPPVQLLPPLHSVLELHVASQLPVPVQRLPPHSLAGSAPAGAAVQVPTRPGTLHAMQVPVQAESQQTPSAQEPEAQSPLRVQVLPCHPSAAQAPDSQCSPAPQSASARQVSRQLPRPSQVKRPQPPSTSVPAGRAEQPPS